MRFVRPPLIRVLSEVLSKRWPLLVRVGLPEGLSGRRLLLLVQLPRVILERLPGVRVIRVHQFL